MDERADQNRNKSGLPVGCEVCVICSALYYHTSSSSSPAAAAAASRHHHTLLKYFHCLVLLYILFCYQFWWCSFKPSCYECTRYRQCILVLTYFVVFLLLHFVWI